MGGVRRDRAGPGLLAGDYVGASGEATIAAGLGANVLIGGSNRTVALQPLSVTGQVGLNLAVGVADLQTAAGALTRSDGLEMTAAAGGRHCVIATGRFSRARRCGCRSWRAAGGTMRPAPRWPRGSSAQLRASR